MKLNTPSTWTNQKIASLFLLSLLKVKEIKAGQTFKECLTSRNASSADAYDKLITFPFSNSEYQTNLTTNNYLRVCCDTSPCSSTINRNCVDNNTEFRCKKFGQTIFCDTYPWLCGGVAGNTLITTNYNSNATSCPSIQTVVNNLTGVTTNHGYAKGYCTGDSNCVNVAGGNFHCYLDNGGWSCYDCLACNCFLQWADSSSTQLSLTSSTTSFVSSSTSSTSSSYIPDNSNPNNLNIILPTTIGGTVIIATASGCYIIRKKRKNKTLQETQKSSELETDREIPVLPTASEEEIDLMELPTYSLSSPNEREERETKNQQELSQKPHVIEELNTSDAERKNNYHHLLTQIKAKLGNEQELLENFLDAQEIIKQVPNSVQAQRNYQRVKQLLGQKISWTEMDALENSYLQKPHEQYHAYTESGSSHRTGDVHLAR